MKVFNVLGQEVKTLIAEVEDAGFKSVQWDAANVSSGIYFYRIEATSTSDANRNFTQVRKMLLMK